jgi:hypothetical protein
MSAESFPYRQTRGKISHNFLLTQRFRVQRRPNILKGLLLLIWMQFFGGKAGLKFNGLQIPKSCGSMCIRKWLDGSSSLAAGRVGFAGPKNPAKLDGYR